MENYNIERKPQCDSFRLFECGAIADKAAIDKGIKNESWIYRIGYHGEANGKKPVKGRT